ncbi:MAG: dihydrolipoyl dehydrogenase [Rickettsiales bacterium]
MAEKYDVAVIGGGPGGYVAAIRAAQLGLKTALVEANHLGGVCLNWGCIPTKALLRVSDLYHSIREAERYGISVQGASFDIKKIVARSREVATKLSGGISHLMKKNGITVYDGFGSLNGKGKIKVEKGGKRVADIETKNIVLATGARARRLPSMECDGKNVLTYKEAMVPETMPKKLLVVGSGAIGVEFASFYADLGADVTVVEAAARILPVEDAEIAGVAEKIFKDRGIKIFSEAKVQSVKAEKDGVVSAHIVLKGKDKAEKFVFDRAIIAVGVVANVENLGLDGTRICVEKGHVVTDEYMRTDEPNVYAIGDLTSAPWLAHKASHEGVIAAEHIAGKHPHPMTRENIPGCTYCRPQIASVGLTEEAAKAQGKKVKVGRFPYMANGKAIAMGETDGLVKTIFDADSGELLGAHIVGAEATEMISSYLVGKTMEATEEDFIRTVFPHPTLGEMMHESVLAAYGKALHT